MKKAILFDLKTLKELIAKYGSDAKLVDIF